MRDFKTLIVWEKAHELALEVYRSTSHFPADERFGLTLQIRRSSQSVPTNLAEGCGRETERELARFVSIAIGSISETEYQIILASDLGYLTQDQRQSLTAQTLEVRRMLIAFHTKLDPR